MEAFLELQISKMKGHINTISRLVHLGPVTQVAMNQSVRGTPGTAAPVAQVIRPRLQS